MDSPDSRPVVLVAIDWYLPAFRAGGPIRSITNIVAALGDDIDFRIVCGNQDLGADFPLSVEVNTWHSHGKASVLYLPKQDWAASRWTALLHDIQPDLLYLNSLYSGPFSRLPWKVAKSMGTPTTLAPRGMLGPGALSVKPFRKRIWLWLQKLTGRYEDIHWHASTEQEASEIRAWFPTASIHVALNLPVPFSPTPINRQQGEIHVLSVGRIHPIKNYPFGVDIAKAMVHDATRVKYRIVGPIEDGAEADRIRQQSDSIELELTGPVSPAETADHFAWADLVLVPSFNENFGHSVAEAVAAARPVIVSDQTAWSNLHPGPSVRCLPLQLDAWHSAAQELLGMSMADLQRHSEDTHRRCLLDAPHLAAQRALFLP